MASAEEMQFMARTIQQLSDQMNAMRVELDQAKSSAVEADIRADQAEDRAQNTDRLLAAVERLATGSGKGSGSGSFPTSVDTWYRPT